MFFFKGPVVLLTHLKMTLVWNKVCVIHAYLGEPPCKCGALDMVATTIEHLTQNACDAGKLASLPLRFSFPFTTPSTAHATTYFPAPFTTPSTLTSHCPHQPLSQYSIPSPTPATLSMPSHIALTNLSRISPASDHVNVPLK